MDKAPGNWRDAWRRLGVPEPPGLLGALIARYSEPHRAYHNIRHIEECFHALAPAAHLAERLAEVHLALWFHDAIYDPRGKDNEQASADLARESGTRRGGETEAVGGHDVWVRGMMGCITMSKRKKREGSGGVDTTRVRAITTVSWQELC